MMASHALAVEAAEQPTSPVQHIGDSSARASTSSCGIPFDSKPSWRCDWSYGRRFQGLVMGTPTTNVIASVIMAGPRADDVVNCFKSIDGMEVGKSFFSCFVVKLSFPIFCGKS